MNSLGRKRWLLYQCDHTGGSWRSVVPESAASSAELRRVWPPLCCPCSPEPRSPGRPIPGRPGAEPHGAEGGQRSRKGALCSPFYPSYRCWCCCWCYHQVGSLCLHGMWAPCLLQLHPSPSAGTWASPALPPAPLLDGSKPLTCCWTNKQEERILIEKSFTYFCICVPLLANLLGYIIYILFYINRWNKCVLSKLYNWILPHYSPS